MGLAGYTFDQDNIDRCYNKTKGGRSSTSRRVAADHMELKAAEHPQAKTTATVQMEHRRSANRDNSHKQVYSIPCEICKATPSLILAKEVASDMNELDGYLPSNLEDLLHKNVDNVTGVKMLATPDDFGLDAMGAGDDREIRSLNKLSRLVTPQVVRPKVWITYALILSSFALFHEPSGRIDLNGLWCETLVKVRIGVNGLWCETPVKMGTKFEIEKFDGRINFDLWQVQVKDVLIQSGLYKALKERPTSEKGDKDSEKSQSSKDSEKFRISDEEWEELDMKAASPIRLFLAKNVLANVIGLSTTKELWEKLEELYQTKSLKNCTKSKVFQIGYI
ncbi:hypothetical protein T459_03257 [Capsicum annuum]|uniref:Uncharacterized protein n=1 Tax=Capsicum annuum TaxID=4072 RepID=A0A2G3AMB5_CAPAN|nr:hypothetical protein T459_03257 [Capsicum annuum]